MKRSKPRPPADVIELVYAKPAEHVRHLFAHVPEELRFNKLDVNRASTRAQDSSRSSSRVATPDARGVDPQIAITLRLPRTPSGPPV